MKQLTLITPLLATLVFCGCKKDDPELKPLSSLTIVNALIAGKTAKLGTNAATIANNSSTLFTLIAGENKLYIYPTTDSLHPYYNNTLTTAGGEIYTLFLGGDTLAVDAVVVKDNLPYRTDSSFGVRFINLSPNSSPINISLASTPGTTEVQALAYKQITDFKSYPALASSGSFDFEFRESTKDSVLSTFSVSPIPRFKNITLVFSGLVGGSPDVSITRVNHY